MSDLAKELRIMAGMITMCERISFGSDSALMEKAADKIERLERMKSELRETMANQQDLIDALEIVQESLEQENAEIKAKISEQAAQIEQLHNSGEKMALDLVNSTEYHSLRSVKDWAELKDSTPAQCLAEIREKCYEHGFLDGYYQPEVLTYPKNEAAAASKNYANQLRQQESK